MLEFPADYFEREVQDGHLVGQLVKRAWAVQLDVLDKIDGICKKHNLTYFAYWGTLIGAVRHQGFIPWDDDMDIAMPRQDYMKFIEIAREELPEEYRLINNYEEDWVNSFTRVTNSRKIYIEGRKLEENHNCPFMLGVDIFPLSYIPRDEREAEEQEKVLRFIGTLQGLLIERKEMEKRNDDAETIQKYNVAIAENLIFLEKLCGVHFEGGVSLSKQLNILYDQVAALFTEAESDFLTDFPSFFRNGYKVSKEFFSEIVRVPFENTTIPIPCGYDSILRKTYGDYTVPRKIESTHGDLCFRPQIRILADALEEQIKTLMERGDKDALLDEVKSKCFSNGEKKSIILVHNSVYEIIANETCFIEKMRAVFRIFKQREDVVIWWRAAGIELDGVHVLKEMLPQLVREYRELVKEYVNGEYGIYDVGGEIATALEYCDAYYGDEGKISKLFMLSQKPVMIMDYRNL